MKEKLFKLLIILPFIWLFSGLLFFRSGDKLMIVLILLSIVTTLSNYGLCSIKKNMHDKGLWIVIAMTVYGIFSYYYHGFSSREIRALLGAALLLFTFPRELITKDVLKWLIVLGSIIILFSTYYFSEYLNLARDQWPINAIPHGTMGAVIAILALTLLINEKNGRDRVILSSCLIIAVIAVVMGQTRGIWLGLVIATVIILLFKVKIKHINWKYILITLAIISIVIYVAKPMIQQRISQTQAEITSIQSGDLNTSIGLRLQMWALAPQSIEEHPILGSGHEEIFKTLSSQGDISKDLMEFSPSHYHNQYIDRLVKGGVIGLILLLVMLAYPLIVTSSGISQQTSIGIVTIYAVGSITDVPFNHGSSLFMYLLLIFALKLKNDEANC